MKAMLAGIAAGLFLSAPAFGQAPDGPAEQPPAGYAGREFVDSQGCAFARGALDEATMWLRRVGADGQPVCGQTPSVPALQAPEQPKAAVLPDAGKTPARPKRTAAGRRALAPALPPDRWVVAVETALAGSVGCGGPERPVPVVTLRNGARHAACDAPAAGAQALVKARGPEALGPALPPLVGPATMVHVGAFHVPANAERAAARLRSLGLPVARGTGLSGTLLMVMTGPVGADQVRGLTDRLRANGFPDAYADAPPAAPYSSQMP